LALSVPLSQFLSFGPGWLSLLVRPRDVSDFMNIILASLTAGGAGGFLVLLLIIAGAVVALRKRQK
jgi:hypothetical protein